MSSSNSECVLNDRLLLKINYSSLLSYVRPEWLFYLGATHAHTEIKYTYSEFSAYIKKYSFPYKGTCQGDFINVETLTREIVNKVWVFFCCPVKVK